MNTTLSRRQFVSASALAMAGLALGCSRRSDAAPARQGGGGGLEPAVSQAIYRVDAVTRRAAALQAHPLNRGPRIALHPADARVAGLEDGAMAKVLNDAGTATLPVEVSDKVAQGAAWVESGHAATAALGTGRVRVEAIR